MIINNDDKNLNKCEIIQSVYIGDMKIVLGVNENESLPYLICCSNDNNILNIDEFTDVVVTDDYLEAMQEFIKRIESQIEAVKKEQLQLKTDVKVFTSEHYVPIRHEDNIAGQVVVLDISKNRYEYRTAAYQLVYAEKGFGTDGNRRGRAVFGTELATGKKYKWYREDFIGILKSVCIPEWAEKCLNDIKKEKQQRRNNNVR